VTTIRLTVFSFKAKSLRGFQKDKLAYE